MTSEASILKLPIVAVSISSIEENAIPTIWPVNFEWIGLLWCVMLIFRANVRLQERKMLYGLHLIFSALFCLLTSIIKYDCLLLRVSAILLALPVAESLAKKQTHMMHNSLHEATRVAHYSGNTLFCGCLLSASMVGSAQEFFRTSKFMLFIPCIYFPMKLAFGLITSKGYSPWFRTNAYIPLSCMTILLLLNVDLAKSVLLVIMTTFVLPSTIIPRFFTYDGTYFMIASIFLWQTALFHFEVETTLDELFHDGLWTLVHFLNHSGDTFITNEACTLNTTFYPDFEFKHCGLTVDPVLNSPFPIWNTQL